MAAKQEPGELLVDGLGQFDAGMNGGMEPTLLQQNQVAFATNMTFRGGYGSPRPSLREVILDFGGDLNLQELCTRRPFQGACFYQPDTGAQALVAAIGGKLWQFLPSGTTCPVRDVSIPNDPNPSNVSQAWLFPAERWVIWNDGVSLPVFFDGTTSRRSNGATRTLATISGTFTSPAVGENVVVNITAPYTGPNNIAVFIDDEVYTLIGPGSDPGIVSAQLTVACFPQENTFPVGAAIIADSQRVGMFLSLDGAGSGALIFPMEVGFVSGKLFTSVLCDVNGIVLKVGDVVSIGRDSFSITSITPFNPFIFPTQPMAVTLKVFGAPATVEKHVSGEIITRQSSLPSPTIGVLTQAIHLTSNTAFAFINPIFTGQHQFIWINNTRFEIFSIISGTPPPPASTIILQNAGDTAGQSRSGPITSVAELPVGRMGTYGLGRIWMSLTDGRSFMAGDIVGGSSGTAIYSFRDAILRSTENTYLAGGGNFFVPGTLGDIRALRFAATLDASLGQGPLQVFTTQAAFSCNAPVDRTTWDTLTNPILTQSLLGAGALAQDATILANGDILFRAIDGDRSLILARRDFDTWGNVPQSREVQTILDQDDPTLIQFVSAVVFDNRRLLTCLPTNGPLGVFCQGIVALNFDPVSTLRGKAPSIWDGLWTGLQILKLVQGVFSGVDRCYAFCFDSVVSKIRLFEIQKTEAEHFDNASIPITFSFESAALFNNIKNKNPLDLVELVDGEIYVSDLRGVVNFQTWYRSSFSDCWTPWFDFSVCNNNTDPSTPLGYRNRLGLGSPDVTVCDPNTNMPRRIGNTFQFRLQITGNCKFRGAKFFAARVPQTKYSVPKCEPLCDGLQTQTDCEACVDIPDCLKFPLVFYNLNANKSYANDATVINVTCPDGRVQAVPVPQGTINYTLPFPPGFTGTYPPLVMNCLSGGVIVKTLPSGSTQSEIDVIVNEMILECVTAYAQSIADCSTTKVFSSLQVSVVHQCEEGTTLTFNGTLPSWISIDTDTSTLIGNPGAATSNISVEDATAIAQQNLDDFVAAQLLNGNLTCAAPSNVCQDGLGNLGNNCYAISGYFDGLVPNESGNPPGDVVYDGTFKFFDPDQGQGFWFGADVSDTQLTMNAFGLCNVELQFRGCTDDVPLWRIQFNTNGNNWRGEKTEGNTPEGVYTRVSGLAPGPATLTIIKISGTTTLPANTQCVS